MAVLIAGCGREEPSQAGKNGSVTQASADGVPDVDLTSMSSTMVYAEVSNIMTNPDKYFGKRIKIGGLYYASYFDETDLYYHYVIISDATACCKQGIEFIWKGEHTYPDDYPEEDAIVEIIGIFGKYDELDKTYYYLSVDSIKVL